MIDCKTATNERLKEEYKRLAKLVGDLPFVTKKEFYHLPALLLEGERPQAVVTGLMDGHTWLITLTNFRLLFLNKSLRLGLKHIAIDLDMLMLVEGHTRMMAGSVALSTPQRQYQIDNLMKSAVAPFTRLVNEARQRRADSSVLGEVQSSKFETINPLEKLAALPERAILDDGEFLAQKDKLLAY